MRQILSFEFANKRAKYVRNRLYAIAAKVVQHEGIVAQHLIHITNKKNCLYEALEVDQKVKNILNQVLDHNSQLTLNACDLRQKNRMTLVEKNKNLSVLSNPEWVTPLK